MKVFLNFFLYSSVISLFLSIVEVVLFKSNQEVKISKSILFVFFYINYIPINFLISSFFSTLHYIFLESHKSLVFKVKLNNFLYNTKRKSIFLIRFLFFVAYLGFVGIILFLFGFGELKKQTDSIEWNIFYTFSISSIIFLLSILSYFMNAKMKTIVEKIKNVSYKQYVLLLFTSLFIVIMTSAFIVKKGYDFKIFYVIEFFFIIFLNFFVIILLLSTNQKKHTHHKIVILILLSSLFLSLLSLFNHKHLNLKNIQFVLSQENFLSEKINIKILEAFFDKDKDGFYSLLSFGDCNDSEKNVNPLAFDIPDNNIDENCDGFDEKSIFSYDLTNNKNRYKSITLNYSPKILIIILKNFNYEEKNNLFDLFKKDEKTIIFKHIILNSPNFDKNLNKLADSSNTDNVLVFDTNKVLEKKVYYHEFDFNASENLKFFNFYKKIIESKEFTEVFLIPFSLSGSGKLGYYGSNKSLFIDQIDSFLIVNSQAKNYKNKYYESYYSLFDVIETINDFVNIKKHNANNYSLTSEILFNSEDKVFEKPIFAQRKDSFDRLLETTVIFGKTQCIENNIYKNFNCFQFDSPQKNITQNEQLKQKMEQYLKQYRNNQ